ncbi:MAG: quinone-interacting membrane-bound oxidoreductase complex subunit QmoC [Deltaproteobacteria bacterium]|nr:quinone-interacting membrane-bound oxidoreductase complex subunit QmoC [Deltaproteobacteria bacterium]
MADKYLVEPDVNFVKEIVRLGGGDVKKCFQCATCSVVCPISPDNKPFPRKEMIAAQWGLKDKLVSNLDIWLCHQCGDCSTQCPRGANPGDVLGAVRSYAISEYAVPKWLAKAVNDPGKLPVLLLIPVVIFVVLGFITGLMDFSPGGEEIVHSHFFSSWLVDMIFVPLTVWVIAIFAMGLNRFIKDMHESAVREGKTDKTKLELGGFLQALVRILPTILKHSKFTDCGENKDRATAHLMVFYAFVGLFVVTNIFFVVLYVFQIHGPYSQLNPVKWLANVSGIALVIGSALMIKNRIAKTTQSTSYKDWYLLGLVLGLGLTGMLTEMTRLAGAANLSYFMYFIHLVFVFNLFAFLPFSKLAHIVYRTVAMAYAEYANR